MFGAYSWGDSEEGYIIDGGGGKVKLPRGSSDAALMPYHVDRSKLYVADWIGGSKHLDAPKFAAPSVSLDSRYQLERIARATKSVCL